MPPIYLRKVNSGEKLRKNDDVAKITRKDPEAVNAGGVEGQDGCHDAEEDHECPERKDVFERLGHLGRKLKSKWLIFASNEIVFGVDKSK